jgi:hypothetical protein
MYPVCCSTPCCKNLLLPTALVGAGVLAAVGMFRVEGDRIVLRDTTEALTFVQELVDLLGVILPR